MRITKVEATRIRICRNWTTAKRCWVRSDLWPPWVGTCPSREKSERLLCVLTSPPPGKTQKSRPTALQDTFRSFADFPPRSSVCPLLPVSS